MPSTRPAKPTATAMPYGSVLTHRNRHAVGQLKAGVAVVDLGQRSSDALQAGQRQQVGQDAVALSQQPPADGAQRL